LQEAKKATDGIVGVLEEIDLNKVRANVSIKLTQIGLALDDEICSKNLERILSKAKELDNFVRIDMEDTPYINQTIRLFREMRNKGFVDVGIVVQSYLYRTEQDTRELLEEGASFRLVKGAYKEPANLAYPKKVDVDASFDLLANIMIDGAIRKGSTEVSENGRKPPVTALGTHDEKRINAAKKYAQTKELPKKALEIQMLYGIRRDLQVQLANEEYPVRVYVPFGTHWYPYFVRRLAERPANIWFFISNFFKK
jgi:proline dehydrogenase